MRANFSSIAPGTQISIITFDLRRLVIGILSKIRKTYEAVSNIDLLVRRSDATPQGEAAKRRQDDAFGDFPEEGHWR